MITTKKELNQCLNIEKKIYFPYGGVVLPFSIREKDILFRYIKYLRKTEYHEYAQHFIRSKLNKAILHWMQNKYCLRIPENTCGVGLSIAHVGPIIIHGDCRIGDGLRIHVGANIGANGGKTPQIGSRVYIGPGAKIFGEIKIADGCRIGANAVVNKSCEIQDSILVGIPARQIEK